MRTVAMGGGRNCQIVRFDQGSHFRTVLKAAIWQDRHNYPCAQAQGWGHALFDQPWTGNFEPEYFAAIPDGAPAIGAALIEHDVVVEIDPDAPPAVLALECWLAGVNSIYESADQQADVPIQVRSLADAMIERAVQRGRDRVHILTDLPPAGANLLFGRPYTVIDRWYFRKQMEVVAAEIKIAA